jgi:hypothetical protein
MKRVTVKRKHIQKHRLTRRKCLKQAVFTKLRMIGGPILKRTRKLFTGGSPALTKLTMIGPILRSALYRTPKKVELLAILKSIFTNAMEDLSADKLATELDPLEKEIFTAYRYYKGMVAEHPFLQARDKLQTSKASANFMQLTKHIFNDKSKQKVFADNLSLFFTNEEKLNAKDYKLFTEKVSQEYAGDVVPYAEFQYQRQENFSKKTAFSDQMRMPDPTLQIGKENMKKREEDLKSRKEAMKQAELKEVASELIQLIKMVENTTPQTILKAHIKAVEDKAKINEMFKEIAADVTTDDFQSKQRTYEENIAAYELSVYLEKQMKDLKRMQQEKNHSVKKVSPAKVSPAKSSPAKSSPAKVSPAKVSPAKSSPAKSSPKGESPKVPQVAQASAVVQASAVPQASVPQALAVPQASVPQALAVPQKLPKTKRNNFGLTQRNMPPIIQLFNQPSFAASTRFKSVLPKQASPKQVSAKQVSAKQASPKQASPLRSPDISSPTQQKRSRRGAFDLEALKPTEEDFGFDLFPEDNSQRIGRRPRRNAFATFEEQDDE